MSSSSYVSLLERIESSDPELKELRLTEAPEAYYGHDGTLEEFNHALASNTMIDYIRIDRDFLPCMKDEYSIEMFFTAMGQLVSLKEVHVWHAAFDVTSLLGFLRAARNLDFLELGCLELTGTTEDFAGVSNALQNHPTLRVFHMVDFCLTTTGSASSTASAASGSSTASVARASSPAEGAAGSEINTLVTSLSSVPQIEIVKLEVTSSRRRSLCGGNLEVALTRPSVHLSGEALATLVTSPTLRELQLNRISLQVEDYQALGHALKTRAGPNFVSLAIPHCDLTDDGCSYLAEAIATSDCKLQRIDFSCNKLTDEGCIMIASSLKGNTSVKTLRLWGNVKISNAGFDALVEMLEVNCHLERVPLMAGQSSEYGTIIDAALLKNRSRASAQKTTSSNRAA